MMSSRVRIDELKELIGNKSFSELKSSDLGKVCIKEKQNESHNNLYLITYEKDDNTSSLSNQCNGFVFEKDTNKLVVANQTKVVDVSNTEMQSVLQQQGLASTLQSDNQTVRVEYCEDGTVIRLYNYNDVWYTATTRCMDARDSYWSSNKTFDQMFWEVFDRSLLPCLDTNSTYLFVVLHKENRIVVRHKYNSLVYICRIDNTTLCEDYKNINIFRDVNSIKRPKCIPLLNIEEVERSYQPPKRGVIIKLYDNAINKWNMYKIDFKAYKHVKEIRGNVPQIQMRFIELLKDPDSLALLEQFYPEYNFLFVVIKHSIANVVKSLYKLYVESHIKHIVRVDETHPYYRTLKQLHAHYKNNNVPITFGIVEQKVINMDKNVLRKFLGWA